MRNASDLRIGNFIQDFECEPYVFKVEEIRKYVGSELWVYYRNGSIKAKDIDPIPLTEEWLLKFGIYVDGQSISLKSGTIGVIQRNRDGRFKYYLHSAFGMVHLDSIQYVHQLQNLYFALTGQELKLNEI